MSLGRYWRTVRHLKASQVWHQLLWRVWRPVRPGNAPHGFKGRLPVLVLGCPRHGRFSGANRFSFLGRERDFGERVDWNAENEAALWRYNLHYFEYLAQPDISETDGWRLMRDWMAGHPFQEGAIGWQPYPTSLRLAHWIRWLARTGKAPEDVLASIWRQADWLSRRVEWHILGNHLFVNGKALWFAGEICGERKWLEAGKRIVLEQLKEQFLPDGGQFELSPMYHALAVEDLLDLYNLTGDAVVSDTASRALGWLRLLQGRGELPLLNDAAEGVAPSLEELEAYAERLNVPAESGGITPQQFDHGWEGWNCSGYRVFRKSSWRVLFDTAPIGPDYLPGHAHCDMLSVLCDVDGRPVLTDTGVFEYAESERRHYCRSTLAHNTVSLDGLEQAEIWKSFRVGRRGYPTGVVVHRDGIEAGHDGFAAQVKGLGHRRHVVLNDSGFTVQDRLFGPGPHEFVGRWHIAPGQAVTRLESGVFKVGEVMRIELRPVGADEMKVELIETDYFPQFGVAVARSCIEFSGRFDGETRIETTCTFCS